MRNALMNSINSKLTLSVCLALFLPASSVFSQSGSEPPSPQETAPIDITGYWVSLITDDWQYRMITPPRGDYPYIPLNAAGRAIADNWDPARDEAAGDQCKGYGAPAIMRLPGRLNIQWQDAQTLRMDIDTGEQTRIFHFGDAMATGARSWQGFSSAHWDIPGINSGFGGAGSLALRQRGSSGSLQVDTTNLRSGYLRKNGVPFSEQTFMTEYYNLISEDDGAQYLVIQTFVEDPQFLNAHFVRTLQFKRESDGSKWNPRPCSAR